MAFFFNGALMYVGHLSLVYFWYKTVVKLTDKRMNIEVAYNCNILAVSDSLIRPDTVTSWCNPGIIERFELWDFKWPCRVIGGKNNNCLNIIYKYVSSSTLTFEFKKCNYFFLNVTHGSDVTNLKGQSLEFKTHNYFFKCDTWVWCY